MREARYRQYLLGLLCVLSAFNLMDGLAMGLLLQNIKLDLALSDTQLGLLTGIAFAFFYSVMGVPIARWADRGNRVRVIAVTTALWGVAVALCATARTFWQLLWIRVVVAVGEAGCVPAASSLIGDYFSRAQRPRAMARYMLAAPLSCVIGYFLAGWINESLGWRATFICLGLPGLLLAVVAGLTLQEPRAVAATRPDQAPPPRPACGVGEICVVLWSNRTFRHLMLSYAIMTFCGNGTTQWLSAYLIRRYGVGTGELGTWFAVIYGTGGALGAYWGGELASRYAARNERMQLFASGWLYGGLAVTSACVYTVAHLGWAFALIWINSICAAVCVGPLLALIQTLVPQQMRAQAIAIVFLISNLVGMGLGPLAVGALSDFLQPRAGEASLRVALLALTPTYLWIAWHLRRAGRTVQADIQALEIT